MCYEKLISFLGFATIAITPFLSINAANANTKSGSIIVAKSLTGCKAYTEDDKTLKISKDEQLAIHNFNCSRNGLNTSAFQWQVKSANTVIDSGILKTTGDTSGLVGFGFE